VPTTAGFIVGSAPLVAAAALLLLLSVGLLLRDHCLSVM